MELRDVNAFQSMDRNDKERYMIQKPSLNHPAILSDFDDGIEEENETKFLSLETAPNTMLFELRTQMVN